MKDNFLHQLYLKHYANKAKRPPREVCIRCGARAILGTKRPWLGLCKKCRKLEWKAVLVVMLLVCSPMAWADTASWYDSKSVASEGTCRAERCYTASGKEIHELEKKGERFCAATKDFALGSRLKVTRADTGKSVTVIVRDRGGFKKYGRTVDLCKKAFAELAPTSRGLISVTVERI